ncbi:aminoacyl tRNA synthase complex-interacting multifunctional protein 2 [Halyomorpha halys]|uniref:aminoacyl tRNA synthase complex-interacting multifunctional protein 2 n=1 Tax=Halyomorpha halys TaxID=286706 RepID=UPI0006D4D5B2|nr:aminoacyl tRNA synthase complex-interacting multifunctional protein 2 [Halyomorpha halys]
MYQLKPLIDFKDKLCTNSPMYSMKSIHNKNVTGDSNEIVSDDIMLNNVEKKQDELLKQIKEIKDLLAILKVELSKPKIASPGKELLKMNKKNVDFLKNGVNYEVVLNASVKNPPNSLLVLNKLWPDLVTFEFSWHVHSSIKGLPKNLQKFENLIVNNKKSTNSQLRIRVVWKEVWCDCELVVSPLNCVPLLGEVNFLRFLNSSLSQEEMDSSSLALFETKLDICHCLQYCDNIQQQQEYYSILVDKLEKNKWLAGNQLTIVDVACWSALNNMKNPNLNPSLSKWFNDCNAYLTSGN